MNVKHETPDTPTLLARAVVFHQHGKLAEAEQLYREVLSSAPGHFDAGHMLGVIRHQQGRDREALELIDRALKANPKSADALTNRGVVLARLNRLDEALASYNWALAFRPADSVALNNRGNVLRGLNRLDAALDSYEQALAVKPDYPEALNNRGSVLKTLGRNTEALASFDRALELSPDYVDALNSRGSVLAALDRWPEALAAFAKTIELAPSHVDALNNHGGVLAKLNRWQEALTSIDRALALKPDLIDAINNRGAVLRSLRRPAEALASYDAALALNPNFAEAHNNRGNALTELDRNEEAIASYDRALAIKPDYAEAWKNRGGALDALNRSGEAILCFARARSIRHDYADAHMDDAMCRLLNADFEHGWPKYEWRWNLDAPAPRRRDFTQPRWLGNGNISEKTILLHAEQGLGDTIQFCRYVPLVAQTGARVLLEVQPELKALLSGIEGARQVLAKGEPLPHFDVHSPLLSLPLAFNTELATIPASTPYLSAAPDRVEKWRALLGPSAKRRIGIAWSGNPDHKRDRHRSIALDLLLSIVGPDDTLVSLQKEVRTDDRAALAQGGGVVHFGEALEDFADTAALLSLMDLVISVDTAVAHLAGALGRPVWILLPFHPDWRWLLNRADSPWYPTARLYRQTQIGRWDDVLRRVGTDLASRARQR